MYLLVSHYPYRFYATAVHLWFSYAHVFSFFVYLFFTFLPKVVAGFSMNKAYSSQPNNSMNLRSESKGQCMT